jgi:hypothetical protein
MTDLREKYVAERLRAWFEALLQAVVSAVSNLDPPSCHRPLNRKF